VEVRERLEFHLSHCRICQVIYDSTCKTVKIVTETGSFDLPQDVSEGITEGIMAKLRPDGCVGSAWNGDREYTAIFGGPSGRTPPNAVAGGTGSRWNCNWFQKGKGS
jgi:hypothetical protein